MPIDILFKKNKNGSGLFNYKAPFIQTKSLKMRGSATTKSITTPPRKHKGFIGAKMSRHLDLQREQSLV